MGKNAEPAISLEEGRGEGNTLHHSQARLELL